MEVGHIRATNAVGWTIISEFLMYVGTRACTLTYLLCPGGIVTLLVGLKPTLVRLILKQLVEKSRTPFNCLRVSVPNRMSMLIKFCATYAFISNRHPCTLTMKVIVLFANINSPLPNLNFTGRAAVVRRQDKYRELRIVDSEIIVRVAPESKRSRTFLPSFNCAFAKFRSSS